MDDLYRKIQEGELRELFNIDRFYDQQWKAVEQILNKKKVLLIEKTGFGKSLCFQYPATQFDGLTIVFSPLIALMRDQVKYLKTIGIKAECVNSQQENNDQIIEDSINGKYKILYIAPERLNSDLWNRSVKEMKISMLVIDEAHCISVWGHDFRPDYRRIINLVNLMPENVPILATTATATRRVQEDIQSQMGSKCISIRGDLLRDNFNLKVVKLSRDESKMVFIKNYLNKTDGNGIIYTGTRSRAEIYAQWLNASNIPSKAYHGSTDSDERKLIEDGLMENKWKCVVSTNALGMGMDKPDIRFIIHEQIPASPIHYYQEIGRGGRDGKDTDLILLFDEKKDLDLPRSFIKTSKPSTEHYIEVINLIKSSERGLFDIINHTNLKQTQVINILADLQEQGICNKNPSSRKYSYIFGKEYKNKSNQKLRDSKIKELELMIDYTKTNTCRMLFLCNYLGDQTKTPCGKCDICKDSIEKFEISIEEYGEVNNFNKNNHPVLPVSGKSDTIKDGYAYNYYGTTEVGSMIRKCKYENGGYFPETLVSGVAKIVSTKLQDFTFDKIFFVPPTESKDLVENFAKRLSKKLEIPFSKSLIKIAKTEPQKIFESGHRKIANVKGKFSVDDNEIIEGKNVLIVDDVYDSGSTLKEICKVMELHRAKVVIPLAIAKTIGG